MPHDISHYKPWIDRSYGADESNTYVMDGACTNCGHAFQIRLKKGNEKPGWANAIACPDCGCYSVRCN